MAVRDTKAFSHALTGLLGPEPPADLGLAVSGGGDSMAMLHLAHDWAQARGVRLWVATVDHGLRAESGAEAAMVAEACARLGHSHAVLRWRWDGQGNVQARARAARLGLIDRWAGGLRHVLMAHTRDDLAETFLMRLNRGAGLRGLAAMRAAREVLPQPPIPGDITGASPPGTGGAGFCLLRPCLGMWRADLRQYLRAKGVGWADDPSNDDPRYERVRMRRALAAPDLGLSSAEIAATAERLAEARAALDQRACDLWHRLGTFDAATGDILFDPALQEADPDTRHRLLSAALRYVATRDYAPRSAPLGALWGGVMAGRGGTLHGCEARLRRGQICISREFAALEGAHTEAAPGLIWDGRWQLGGVPPGLTIRALGEDGWAQAKAQMVDDPPVPHHTARPLPSLWRGDELVVCEALGIGARGLITLVPMRKRGLGFAEFLVSH